MATTQSVMFKTMLKKEDKYKWEECKFEKDYNNLYNNEEIKPLEPIKDEDIKDKVPYHVHGATLVGDMKDKDIKDKVPYHVHGATLVNNMKLANQKYIKWYTVKVGDKVDYDSMKNIWFDSNNTKPPNMEVDMKFDMKINMDSIKKISTVPEPELKELDMKVDIAKPDINIDDEIIIPNLFSEDKTIKPEPTKKYKFSHEKYENMLKFNMEYLGCKTNLVTALTSFYVIQDMLHNMNSHNSNCMLRRRISSFYDNLNVYNQEFSEKLANSLFSYLSLTALCEARHSLRRSSATLKFFINKSKENKLILELGKDVIYFLGSKFSPKSFLPTLEDIFYTYVWESNFGGVSWGRITTLAKKYYTTSNIIFIDLVAGLIHNNGVAYNKSIIFPNISEGTLSGKALKRLLDFKRNKSLVNDNPFLMRAEGYEIKYELDYRTFSFYKEARELGLHKSPLNKFFVANLKFNKPVKWGERDIGKTIYVKYDNLLNNPIKTALKDKTKTVYCDPLGNVELIPRNIIITKYNKMKDKLIDDPCYGMLATNDLLPVLRRAERRSKNEKG